MLTNFVRSSCALAVQSCSGALRLALPTIACSQQQRGKRWFPQRTAAEFCTTAAAAAAQSQRRSFTSDSTTTQTPPPKPTTNLQQQQQQQPDSGDGNPVSGSSTLPVNPPRLDWSLAKPVYAKLPENRPHFATVIGDGGIEVANHQLYEAAIEASELRPAKYEQLSGEERDVYIAHLKAVQLRRLTYRDPVTGYTVLTACQLLLNGDCCGNGCRHCPYGWRNVKGRRPIHNGAYYV